MLDIDVLRKDECQPLTTEQMTNIKSQFHPSNTANVNIVPYHIYDEDEHIVGEWIKTIDGVKKKKSVYEKVIDFGTLPNNATKSVSLGIENLDFVVSTSGVARNSGYYRFLPIIDMDSATWNVAYYIDLGEFKIQTKQNYSSYSAHITICYTKTTDEWQPV